MDKLKKEFAMAKEAREKAYAPYSKFKVGAAIKAKGSDIIVAGMNIENASYGACMCAERTALYSMITQHNIREIEHILVMTEHDEPYPPCGLCLQVLAEFCDGETLVYLANTHKIVREVKFKNLLGTPFNKFEVRD